MIQLFRNYVYWGLPSSISMWNCQEASTPSGELLFFSSWRLIVHSSLQHKHFWHLPATQLGMHWQPIVFCQSRLNTKSTPSKTCPAQSQTVCVLVFIGSLEAAGRLQSRLQSNYIPFMHLFFNCLFTSAKAPYHLQFPQDVGRYARGIDGASGCPQTTQSNRVHTSVYVFTTIYEAQGIRCKVHMFSCPTNRNSGPGFIFIPTERFR